MGQWFKLARASSWGGAGQAEAAEQRHAAAAAEALAEAAEVARARADGAARLARGDAVTLHCHWLSFLRDSHTNLAVVAVIFGQNDKCRPRPRRGWRSSGRSWRRSTGGCWRPGVARTDSAVRARPARPSVSSPSASHSESLLCGVAVWARRALNCRVRRSLTRAVKEAERALAADRSAVQVGR